MLKIRLQRVGRKNIPTFRVVLTDSKNGPKSGKSLEILGSYDPVNDVKEVNADRVKYWLSQGAQLSGTVNNFLIDKGIITGNKQSVTSRRRVIKGKPEGEAGKNDSETEKTQTETPPVSGTAVAEKAATPGGDTAAKQ